MIKLNHCPKKIFKFILRNLKGNQRKDFKIYFKNLSYIKRVYSIENKTEMTCYSKNISQIYFPFRKFGNSVISYHSFTNHFILVKVNFTLFF